MSFTATSKCFYCSNPINRGKQSYVYALIRHNYKNGGTRESDRNFHLSCCEKFEDEGGRPWNPDTRYEVLSKKTVVPESDGLGPRHAEIIVMPPPKP